MRFYIFNNQLRVPKSHFWKSAPNLSHTCDFCRKGEAARFYNMRALIARGPRKSQRAQRCEIFGEEEQQVYEGLAASYARRLPSVALLRRARRGKLRRLAALPRAAGLSSNHGKKFYLLKTYLTIRIISRKRQNHAFAFFPQFAERLTERVKRRHYAICVLLKN